VQHAERARRRRERVNGGGGVLWRGAESSRVAELGDRKHATMDSQTPSRPAAAAAGGGAC